MCRQQTLRTVAAFFLVVCVGGRIARADLELSFSVNTFSLNGENGYLDFQFNPGDSSAEAATATVANFQTDGMLAQSAIDTDNATGSLPGPLTLDNGTVYNDIFQGFTFGVSFSFDLTLSGAAINNPAGAVGSAFAVSLYAADGFTPMLTTDPNGSIATVNLAANGVVSVVTFPQSPTDNSAVATVTPGGQLIATPEPSALTMVLCSVAMHAGWTLVRSVRRKQST